MPPHLRPDRRVRDSVRRSVVDRLPTALRPYARLARWDRPIGIWLLLLPCWMGLLIGRVGSSPEWSDLNYALAFVIGAVAMRGAGCTFNDMVDRNLDAQVARTADRPLAAGTVTLKAASVFLGFQLLVGLCVFIALPLPAKLVALIAIPLVAAYPFMKRITWFPQVWLGFTFNMGVLVGAASVAGLGVPAFVLYAALVLWTVGYDTIYAAQDVDDDALVGIKSTMRLFGQKARFAVRILYGLASGLIAVALYLASNTPLMVFAALPFILHLSWQVGVWRMTSEKQSLALFKSNRMAGLMLCVGLAFVVWWSLRSV